VNLGAVLDRHGKSCSHWNSIPSLSSLKQVVTQLPNALVIIKKKNRENILHISAEVGIKI